jgi:MOSC domain-containing protein YiiM
MCTSRARITGLFISPGHNFFGHHGMPPDQFAGIECESVSCIAGRGIEGDRFLDFKPNYKGQITFFSSEVYDALCLHLSHFQTPPSALRRNVLTSGLDLNSLIGQEFELQGVRFLGTGECSPCYWMDQAFAPGAENFLKGRGGLRARILTSGSLKRDPLLPPPK